MRLIRLQAIILHEPAGPVAEMRVKGGVEGEEVASSILATYNGAKRGCVARKHLYAVYTYM